MKLIRKKNVLKMQNGTEYKIYSPVVNDILNDKLYKNDSIKYKLLCEYENFYAKHFDEIGDEINNLTKAQFLLGFGSLIGLSTYGIIASITEGTLPTIGFSLGLTFLIMYVLDSICEKKNYRFANPTDYPTYKNMRDFQIAKDYLLERNA